jgi:hypothetical protein
VVMDGDAAAEEGRRDRERAAAVGSSAGRGARQRRTPCVVVIAGSRLGWLATAAGGSGKSKRRHPTAREELMAAAAPGRAVAELESGRTGPNGRDVPARVEPMAAGSGRKGGYCCRAREERLAADLFGSGVRQPCRSASEACWVGISPNRRSDDGAGSNMMRRM